MPPIPLIATTAFGLEAVVKRELQALGFESLQTSNGTVEFEAALQDVPGANLWLRSAGRVLLKMGEFEALTFDELFEQTRSRPWEDWITRDGRFTVTGKAVESTPGSVRACQAIVKKAVAERLKERYPTEWMVETGPRFTVPVSMRKDRATLTIDTSGSGLNRRGYRTGTGEAALREALAAALVQLSFRDQGRLLIDPMCGSGTIPIEAALMARNMAPGLNRNLAAEAWPAIPARVWQEERQAGLYPHRGREIPVCLQTLPPRPCPQTLQRPASSELLPGFRRETPSRGEPLNPPTEPGPQAGAPPPRRDAPGSVSCPRPILPASPRNRLTRSEGRYYR